MELRMPVDYPGAAVGGGDAIDGPDFFALNTTQQTALYAFWTASGEFLVRVTRRSSSETAPRRPSCMDIAFGPPTKPWKTMLCAAPGTPVPEALLVAHGASLR